MNIDRNVTVGAAFSKYLFFKNVVWESFNDSSGDKVSLACEYDLNKVKLDCPASSEPELVRADRVFLIVTFLVNMENKTFSVFEAHFESYSKRGYKLDSEASADTLYAVLDNQQSISCKEMLAPR